MVRTEKVFVKVVGCILSVAMTVNMTPGQTYRTFAADGHGQSVQAQEETQSEQNVKTYIMKDSTSVSGYGYQDVVWIDEDGNEITDEELRKKSGGSEKLSRGSGSTFPASYSMADEGLLPSVRDQGNWGTCWAHGAMCSLETNMIKKGLADAGSVDYSERHLAYFAHTKNAALGDGVDRLGSVVYNLGGNYAIAEAELAGWYGAASEADYPYSAYGSMDNLDESERSVSVVHLTDAYELETEDEVKSAVMNYGAVMCAYYSDDNSIDETNYAVYKKSNIDSDTGSEIGTNHVVNIVGWDDDYAVSNFSGSIDGNTPANPGAWLCRNSWGENWGNNGYFWISYEDATIGQFCCFEADTTSDYDNIYQYDGAGYNGYSGYSKSANIFTASGDEELSAVSFYALDTYKYQIEIYLQDGDGMQSPDEGKLVYSQSGSLEFPGYHTIPLDQKIAIGAGEKYAVAVGFEPDDDEGAYTNVEVGDDYSADAGQSFFFLDSTCAQVWLDTTESAAFAGKAKNVCIKAFTDDIEAVDVSRLTPLLEKAAALLEEDYTAESWQTLKEAVAEAEALCAGETSPTSLNILKCEQNLQLALDGMVPAVMKISDANEFVEFTKSVTEGNDYSGQIVKLVNDIDMTGISYVPAGNADNPFNGTFSAENHIIKNLSYESEINYAGLFGYVGGTGMIKDITLENVNFSFSEAYSAGIAAVNNGQLTNCNIDGGVMTFLCTTGGIGGICGINNSTIRDCEVNAVMTFENQKSSGYYFGGITGNNKGRVEGCISMGSISSDGIACAAGIAGYNSDNAVVKMCRNFAKITGEPTGDTKSAGICVALSGTVSECFNAGEITRTSINGKNGGIYSILSGTVSNCYYLDTSCEKAGYGAESTDGKMTAEEFANGKAAYYLNTSGGESYNTYSWGQGDVYPVPADSEHKAVVKVKVTQEEHQNADMALLGGITSGELYVAAGSDLEFVKPDTLPQGYSQIVWNVKGLELSGSETERYLVPDEDCEAVISCSGTLIDYTITFHLNGGNGTDSMSYNVEYSGDLPVPEKENAEFDGWYDNEECTGDLVKSLSQGNVGDKEYWAKWTQKKEEQTTGKEMEETTTNSQETDTDDVINLPDKPKSASVTKASSDSVKIKWKRVPGVSGYEIYRKDGSGSYRKIKNILDSSKNCYTNKNLESCGSYSYKIRSYVTTETGSRIYSKFKSAGTMEMYRSISSDELELSAVSATIKLGKKKAIKLVIPVGRDDEEIAYVKYSSTNKNVANVNAKGTVKGKNKGVCYIRVKVKLENGQSRTLKARIKVKC